MKNSTCLFAPYGEFSCKYCDNETRRCKDTKVCPSNSDSFCGIAVKMVLIEKFTVFLFLKNTEREDILKALKLWVRDHGHVMVGDSKKDLEQLIEKVDCAGSKLTLERKWK